MAKNFQVGIADNPKEGDMWFEGIDNAIEHARELHSRDDRTPYAVWNASCEIEVLWFQNQMFRSE